MKAKISSKASPQRRVRFITWMVAIIALAVTIAAAWNWGSARPTFPAGTRVLLVTIDTLRPDALGFVSGSANTPNIDALALDGVRFQAAIAPVPLTLPSHASLLSGLNPVRHGVHVNGQIIGEGVPLLAEQFKRHGYSTAAFVSATVLKKDFGLSRGFDVYDDASDPDAGKFLQRHATATIAAAKQWIESHGDDSWFVWVHLYDAHAPYAPPRAFWSPGPRGAYDGTVMYMDDALADLFSAAKERAHSQLLTILTADHGESLGEHGEIEHGIFLYDTTMRVPLVFNYPGVLAQRAPDFHPRLIDVMPTVLEGLGWKSDVQLDGVSIVDGLEGHALEIPAAYMETEFPWTSYGWAPLYGMLDGDWKYIWAPEPELYNVASDSHEIDNLAPAESKRVATLQTEIDGVRLATPVAATTVVADPEVLQKLRSLGYLGAGTVSGVVPPGRPDAKSRIRARQGVHQADAIVAAGGDLADALRIFRSVLAEDPENRYVLLKVVVLALELGDTSQAKATLPRAVEQANGDSEILFALADGLTRARQYKEALPLWVEVTALMPQRMDAWNNLGTTAMLLGDAAKALAAYEQALKVDPDSPGTLGNIGEAERLLNRPEPAVSHLILAAMLEGESTHRASRIGLLLAGLQRWDEAALWFERARPADDAYVDGQLRWAGHLVDSDREAAQRLLQERCAIDPRLAEAVRTTAQLAKIADACLMEKVPAKGEPKQ